MKMLSKLKRFVSVLLLTVAGCLSSCASDNSAFNARDQRLISPRNYVRSLGPNDRVWGEAAINSNGRRLP